MFQKYELTILPDKEYKFILELELFITFIKFKKIYLNNILVLKIQYLVLINF